MVAGSDAKIVEGPFEGQFGAWVVDEEDAAEVLVYRASLVGAALSVAAGACMALLPSVTGLEEAPAWAFDVAAAGFFASFGVSLATIHIYMKPMHNFLKALWAAGAVGAVIVLAFSPEHSLVLSSFEHPELLLASGWVFVALTGLFFKARSANEMLIDAFQDISSQHLVPMQRTWKSGGYTSFLFLEISTI